MVITLLILNSYYSSNILLCIIMPNTHTQIYYIYFISDLLLTFLPLYILDQLYKINLRIKTYFTTTNTDVFNNYCLILLYEALVFYNIKTTLYYCFLQRLLAILTTSSRYMVKCAFLRMCCIQKFLEVRFCD